MVCTAGTIIVRQAYSLDAFLIFDAKLRILSFASKYFSLLLCKYPLSKYVFYDTTQKTYKKFGGYEIIIYIGSGIYSRSYEENPFYHWVVEERVLQQTIGA